jgi:hypothetical protein
MAQQCDGGIKEVIVLTLWTANHESLNSWADEHFVSYYFYY